MVVECFMNLTHQKGEGLRMEALHDVLALLAASIEEDILLPRVAVHVNVHLYTLLLVLANYHLLQIINFRVVFLRRILPPSIQIHS